MDNGKLPGAELALQSQVYNRDTCTCHDIIIITWGARNMYQTLTQFHD
jgi:hypothetical protein